MKHFSTLFLTCIFMLGMLTACGGGSDSVVGVWQLDSVSGEELTASEKEATIEFKSDGVMVRTRGDRTKEGTWEMKEVDGKKILVTVFGDRTNEAEVKTLDGTTLSFTERGDLITLKRK